MARNPNAFAFVPRSWVLSGLKGEALRTLILLATHADRETGECWPSNASLAEALGKSVRAIQFDLAEIERAGFISKHEAAGRGRWFKIESPEWYGSGETKPKKRGPNHEEILHPPHEENLHGSPDEPCRNSSPIHEEILHPNHEEILHGPNKNTTREPNHEPVREERSVFAQAERAEFAADLSTAFSDLGRKPEPIPAELKRMATAVNAEAWIGQVQFQEIPLADWRVAETLRILQSRGGNKGPNYAWTIFRGLPVQKPAPMANGHVGESSAARKPAELIGAEARLATARRAAAKGQATPEEIAKLEERVEDLKRKAGVA